MSDELTVSKGEVEALVRTMGQNYRESIEYYRKMVRSQEGLTPQQVVEETEERIATSRKPTDWKLEQIASQPLHTIDWFDMETVEEAQEGQALVLWQKIKEAAREELLSGQRGGEILLDTLSSPFDRARYAVLREELASQWQPNSGIEQTLIEQMAQAQTMYLHWLSIARARMMREYRTPRKQEASYELPRVSEQECQEFATQMAERFHRLFLRTLRALQNMRRYAPVIVQNAGQVNVGAQQINVAESKTE